jgi:polar amino acid transport system substrate-binding protein
MKNILLYSPLIILMCIASLTPLHGKDLSMVTVDWAPYYGSEMKNNGVITVIVTSAFKRSGINANIKFVPWKRAMKEVEMAESDILMGAYYTDERNKSYFYSDPIYDINVGLVALKTLNFTHFKELNELIPYTIGVSRGWANSKAFDQADYLNKQGATNQILNVRKLFKKRIDMISISFDVFRYEVATMGSQRLKEVVFIKPPLQVSSIHLATSRDHPEKENIMEAFNRGLSEIKKDGTYDAILKEYGFRK